uniref:V-type proton ATPase subunit n=1 Tax=Plectus sambesii TaxID=2011161 RepID=A0A914VZF7_9BILA
MGVALPLIIATAFWGIIGAGGPFLVPRGPHRGIAQTMIILTAACCYLFWLLVFLHQLNPLIGPQIDVKTIRWMQEQWGDSNKHAPHY